MTSLATVEEDFFDHILSKIRHTSNQCLDAYTCDLDPTTTHHKITGPSPPPPPNKQQLDEAQPGKKPPRHARHTSMVQVQGISAYHPQLKHQRQHERMASTGIHIRVPHKVRRFYSTETPPSLTPKQQHEQQFSTRWSNPNYISDMIDSARDARIVAEEQEQEQYLLSTQNLDRIQKQEKILNQERDRHRVLNNVQKLMARHDQERKGTVVEDEFSDAQDQMYERWNRRNSFLLTKSKHGYSSANGEDGSTVVKRYYESVRRNSVKHVTGGVPGRANIVKMSSAILGVKVDELEQETPAQTVGEVFGT
jgi:hypothetical protein